MITRPISKRSINLLTVAAIIGWMTLLSFTRFFNIDTTAPFSYDEATDLSRMQDMYAQRKLTPIGPISTDNKKVFSSLSYYLYMPFAILGNFAITSPYYGAAFWGILTGVVFLSIAQQQQSRYTWLAGLLILVWTPLLSTGRHAYNPNLVPFWIALAIAIPKDTRFRQLLAGLFLGLSIHHHYTAAFACFGYIGTFLWRSSTRKNGFRLLLGTLVGVAPLIVFDLTHWPGIFLTSHFTSRETSEVALQVSDILPKIMQGISTHARLMSPYPAIAGISLLVAGVLAVKDYQQKKGRLFWLIPISLQSLVGIFTSNHFEYRYAFASIPFLFTWIILPRNKSSQNLQLTLISLIIASSIMYLPLLLTQATTHPPIKIVKQIGIAMQDICHDPSFINPNIAALQSKDGDTIAYKYRWYLRKFDCQFRAPSEYEVSEQLIVISQASIAEVKQDPAAAMQPFKDAVLKRQIHVGSDWHLYWLGF